MNTESINDLISVMESACTVPTVPTRPLIELAHAIYRFDLDGIGSLPDDHPLLAALSAAEELCESYQFWPPDTYGSTEATVSPDAVMALVDAVAVLREFRHE